MKRILWGLVWTVSLLGTAWAQVQVQSIFPLVLSRGRSSRVSFQGKGLQEATGVWFPAPKVALRVKSAKPQQTTVELRLPPQCPLGVYPLRLVTRSGVSDPRLVLVDSLPVVLEQEGNQQLHLAQKLPLPVALCGTCTAEGYDYFTFQARKGQVLTLEVYAARLGTQADVSLRVLDAGGRELLWADDTPFTGSDPLAVFRVPEDGQYFLVVNDVRFRGGKEFGYVLRVGQFPAVVGVFPLVASARQKQTVHFWTLQGKKLPATVQLGPGTWLRHELPGATDYQRSWVWVRSSPEAEATEELLEREPNDSVKQATLVDALPAALNGQFDRPGDRDLWAIKLQKGQSVRIVGQARRFGSPADLYLRLLDAQGRTVAEADDTRGGEGQLGYKAPASGTYFLAVEELASRGGPGFAYRVLVRRPKPEVILQAEPLTLNAPQGGVAVVKVNALRLGYQGPIHFRLHAPSGIRLQAGEVDPHIPKGKKSIELRIAVSKQLKPGTVWAIRLEGLMGKEPLPLDLLAAWRKAVPQVPYPPQPWLEELILGVGPPFPKFFQLALEPSEAVAVRGLAPAQWKLVLKRLHKDFKGPVSVKVVGAPKGSVVNTTGVPKGKNQGTLQILAGPETPLGTFPLELAAQGEFRHQVHHQWLRGAVLRVVNPVEAEKARYGLSLAPGQKVSLSIPLRRYPNRALAFTLVVQGLPPGVKLQAPKQVDAQAKQIRLSFVAPKDFSGPPAQVKLLAQWEHEKKQYQALLTVVELSPPARLPLVAPEPVRKPASKPGAPINRF